MRIPLGDPADVRVRLRAFLHGKSACVSYIWDIVTGQQKPSPCSWMTNTKASLARFEEFKEKIEMQ